MLDTAGPLALGIPIALVRFDGGEVAAHGTVASLPQSEAQLRGAFSRSGWNAWIRPPVADPDGVEFVRYTGRTGATFRHRVLDREGSGHGHRGTVTRLQLTDPL